MIRYLNLSGNSGVAAYALAPQSILVMFWNGAVYCYTYKSAGQENVEEMKRLAQVGQGLNTFINTTVRQDYASKDQDR